MKSDLLYYRKEPLTVAVERLLPATALFRNFTTATKYLEKAAN